MRELATGLLARSGLAALARAVVARRGRFVIELHRVPDLDESVRAALPEPLRPDLTLADLRALLRWVSGHFRLLTPDEFFAAETPGVLLTFDDGFANQARALPLLEEFEAPTVLFVATDHVADPSRRLGFVEQVLEQTGDASRDVDEAILAELHQGMSRDELARCAASDLITIGAHTVSHPFLTRLGDDALRHELEESKRFLESETRRPIDLMAYPSGDYDRRVAEAACSAGYRAAFVEDSRGLGLGSMEIPRIGLYRADANYLAAKLSGLHRRPLPLGGTAEDGP